MAKKKEVVENNATKAKMRMVDLLEKTESINYLVSRRDKLSGKVNYQISKNIAPIKAEQSAFEESKLAIVKKYANLDENGEPVVIGNSYDIKDEDLGVFNLELKELKDVEIELDVKKIKVDDLEGAGLSAIDYFNLDFMLSE